MKKTLLSVSLVVLMISILQGSHACAGQEYVVGDEDMLQVSVWGNPELTVQVPVRPDGRISVPLIGDVKAEGLTPQELKELLEKNFSKYIKAPTVSVIVTAVNSFKVYVIGEGIAGPIMPGTSMAPPALSASGAITLRRNTTLMQLLAQLGSLKGADLKNAYAARGGQKLKCDFSKLVVSGDISQDIELRPNDIIFIPDNFDSRIRVVGAVRTPGIIQYRDGLTALDAILSSGGFTEFASQNSVIVVRKEENGTRNIEVRMKDVISNGDVSKNIPLRPGDLITVRTGIF